MIPAALVTGLRSDLPGQITAQVTENVFDSPTGRHLLIPQGARLIGVYDNRVSFGQSRVLLVWTRMILPNGRSIVLERMPGADEQGFSGLEDGVDYHWGRSPRSGLSTLLGVGLELGSNNESDIARAIRESGQDTVGRTGEEIVRRQLAVQPNAHGAARLPGSGHRQPRPDPRTLPRLTDEQAQARADPRRQAGQAHAGTAAALHRDLVAYADALSRQSGQPVDRRA